VHNVSRETKIAMYQAVVLTALLYDSDTRTLYRPLVHRLDQFQLCCLRRIAGIKMATQGHQHWSTVYLRYHIYQAIFTARCYTERGYATVMTLRYVFHFTAE